MQMHRKTAAPTIEPQDFLLPDPARRRKSGPTVVRPTQIEDAVFEVVQPSPRPYQHMRMNDNPHRTPPRLKTEILGPVGWMGGRLAADVERRLASLSPQAFVTLLSSLICLVFWMCGGFSALIASDRMAAGAPFSLVDTAIRTQDANGMRVALVTGSVRNDSGGIINAPRLAVVTGARQDILGTVSLMVDRIGPGMTIPFSARFKLDGGKSTEIAIIPERL